MISLIAAMTKVEHIIGDQGKMPWHLPADLAWFKQHTVDKPIIMGRKTWQSLGCVLPSRRNIVVSSDTRLKLVPQLECVQDPQAALDLVAISPEVMIIGGAQLYAYFLPQAQRMYLSFIDAKLKGDTVFPAYQAQDWRLVQEQNFLADAKNPYNYSFTIYERL